MRKLAVLLNGSGHRDGSEIHESTLTLLAIEELGVAWECIALNSGQATVVDHTNAIESKGQERNMLVESARIARGRIKDIATARISDYVGLIIPGGSGTAKNLCDFASAGEKMMVEPSVTEWILGFHHAGKPIGAMCIAPVILAKIFGSEHVNLTLGKDGSHAAKAAAAMGAHHVMCSTDEIAVDDRLKIVTTPAYMYDASIKEIAVGIRKLVHAVLMM